MRVIAPVRSAERHSMPLYAHPPQQLVEAERPLINHNIAALAKLVEELDEAKDVDVAFRQAPIEPADVAILAVRVVIALLGPAHLVAHQQHGGAGRQ